MPLLLDTWSEALLSSGSGLKSAKPDITGSRQVQIRPDVAPILEAVVKTMHLLVSHFRKASEDQDQAAKVLFVVLHQWTTASQRLPPPPISYMIGRFHLNIVLSLSIIKISA